MMRLSNLIAAALVFTLGGQAFAVEPAQEVPAPLAAPRTAVEQAPAVDAPAEAKRPGPKTIAVAVPTSAAVVGPPPDAEILRLPLNKTKPLNLPVDVRDIVVGNPDIADIVVRSPQQIYVAGKAVGDTNVFLLDRNGQLVRRLEINVHLDVDSLRETLRQLLPEERIQVSAVNDSIILAGRVRSDSVAAHARTIARRYVTGDANIVNMMGVAGEQQVLLQVRVAEVQKSVLKELGVNASLGAQTFSQWGSTANLVNSAWGGIGTTTAAFGAGTVTGIGALSATFSMLERQGLVKTLAEPNLTAVSGEVANLLAGGEFPIPVSDKNDQITFEFKPFGVALSFAPVVLDPSRISLKLSTEVSALSTTITVTTANTTIPALTVRRASSVVEMPSGGSLMIAGLLQNDITSSLNGLPGLMDLPILGALFRSTSFQRSETELVILVSAFVVKPVDPKALMAPTDGFVASSDLDRYFLGNIQQLYVKERWDEQTVPALQGPIGYIVN